MEAARDPKAVMLPLKKLLRSFTREGELWKTESNDAVRCFACGHRCFIPKGFDGICKVRSNVDGRLQVPWGYVGGIQVDPVEKKPFFHAYPGSDALSFGMLGCDYRCGYCQNWFTSQVLRDPNASANPWVVTPEELVQKAIRHGAKILTSTYNEPLITSEWAVAVFKEGKKAGLVTSYVSNGNATPEVLEYIRPYVDLYKIDLKGFSDKHYRELGGVLENVCESIKRVYQMGFWLEIVSLLIPGFNDSDEELQKMTEFVATVSPDIPWHATAYHPDYKMLDAEHTSVETLHRAEAFAKKAGLNFVYLGNRPGKVGKAENTYCPSCGAELIVRQGFQVLRNRLKDGHCPECPTKIPGRW